MSLVYRVIAFGQAKGPWRSRERDAEEDAVALGLAERDEWGQLYLDAPVSIEWQRWEDLRKSA